MDTELLFQRIDISVLYQPFYFRMFEVLDSLAKEGVLYYATSGERTFEEQDALYLKGRRGIKSEGKVTNAKGGSSAHNFAIALDSCRDSDIKKAGLQPVWRTEEYIPLADRAIELGLEAGYYWRSLVDGPHIQLPLQKHGISLAQLKTIHLKEGKGAVAAFLDKYDW